MESKPLTIETLKQVCDDLERMRKENEEENKFFGCSFIKNDLLKGTQVIIKSGDKVYYSPDIKAGEVTVITFPPFNPIYAKETS